MPRHKGEPKRNAKTIPQRIARKELIAGGGKEARRRALIAGGGDDPVMMGGGGAMPSTKSAGVLPRNVRGSAPTRRGDASAGAKDKRTREAKRQTKKKLDVKDPKDLKFLEKKERERVRGEKSSKVKKGEKVRFKYYGKEREGTILEVNMRKGVPRSMTIDVVGLGRKDNVDIKNIL
jgi:hypothetical protein